MQYQHAVHPSHTHTRAPSIQVDRRAHIAHITLINQSSRPHRCAASLSLEERATWIWVEVPISMSKTARVATCSWPYM